MKIKKNLSVIMILILTINFCIISTSENNHNIKNIYWGIKELVSSESNDKAYRGIIKADGLGNIHLAWKDKSSYLNSGEDWDIFYKMKNKYGNWTKTEVVSNSSTMDSNCLSMFVDINGNVHISWKDKSNYLNSGDDWDIFYKMKKTDGNWTNTELVSKMSDDTSNCPFLIVDNLGIVHIVWPDASDYLNSGEDLDVFYVYKSNNNNWSNASIITLNSYNDSLRPVLDFDANNNIYVIWEEKSNSLDSGFDSDIFFKLKTFDNNWSHLELVSSESNGESTASSIKVESDGQVHVVWTDNSYVDFDVFYKSRDLNSSWSNTEIVSSESLQICNWPRIDVDKNRVIHVVWVDSTIYNGTGFDSDIIYKYKNSSDYWSDYEVVSFDSFYDSFWPSISVDDECFVHVSWWDDEGGNKWVTYYKMRLSNDFPSYTDVNNNNETPGFEFIFLLILISFLILLKKKKN